MNDWISVKDNLPEDGQTVLCYDPTFMLGGIFTAIYGTGYSDTWFHSAYFDRGPNKPTHWSKLPEPPAI